MDVAILDCSFFKVAEMKFKQIYSQWKCTTWLRIEWSSGNKCKSTIRDRCIDCIA